MTARVRESIEAIGDTDYTAGMIPVSHHVARRRAFLSRLKNPALLFAGGEIPRNSPFMTYPHRADSNFLLFFPPPDPDACAFFDPADGTVTLFLHERTEVDALWMGPRPSFDEIRAALEVTSVRPVERLVDEVEALRKGRPVDSIAVADARATETARRITGQTLDLYEPSRLAPPALRDALAALRMHKAPPEIAEMRRAAIVTAGAFDAAMRATRPGVTEQELAALVNGRFARHGGYPAYETILSVRGEVLHNHGHAGTLADGDLLLVDAGAEVESGWGADITRTWPVDGRFRPEQRDVYEAVLAAQRAAIASCRPGTRWRDIHIAATRAAAEGLKAMGILRGPVDDLVMGGAAALFFPHGVGHLLGLDTHDLRTFGDAVLYGPGRTRSTEPGLAFLRMDLDLAPGMVVTVEPGIYFVPAILRNPSARARLAGVVDFDRAERFLTMNDGRGFGGVRIEDNVVVTDSDPTVLTPEVPKGIAELEAVLDAARATSAAR